MQEQNSETIVEQPMAAAAASGDDLEPQQPARPSTSSKPSRDKIDAAAQMPERADIESGAEQELPTEVPAFDNAWLDAAGAGPRSNAGAHTPADDGAPQVHAPEIPEVDTSWLNDLDAAAMPMAAPTPLPQPAPPEPAKRPGIISRYLGLKPSAPDMPRVGPAAHEAPARKKATNPWLFRGVGIAGVCGIALLSYMQFGPQRHAPLDLLGTSLPDAGAVAVAPVFLSLIHI